MGSCRTRSCDKTRLQNCSLSKTKLCRFGRIPIQKHLVNLHGNFPSLSQTKRIHCHSRTLCLSSFRNLQCNQNQIHDALVKTGRFFVPEFCEEQVSIATTEFSNHPDQAAADEELKHKNHEEESKNKNDSEGVFPKPATPPPITPKVGNNDEKNDTINENSEIITEDEEDSNSDFEKVEPEN